MKGILINRDNDWWVFDLQYYMDAYDILVKVRNVELNYDKYMSDILKTLTDDSPNGFAGSRGSYNRVELEYWKDWDGENPYQFIREYQLRRLNGDESYYEVNFKFHRDTFNGKLKSPEFVTLHTINQ